MCTSLNKKKLISAWGFWEFNPFTACFYSWRINGVLVTFSFIVLRLENKKWREWVIRCLRSPRSIRGKYIHLIETLCPLLSNHSLISHTTHPCHNLDSSLPFITPFCNLAVPLPLSLSVCHLHPSAQQRAAARSPHRKVHHEVWAVSKSDEG